MPAIFQISEPGEARSKEACATGAVGIDLGTTNSLVAIVLGDSKPRALAVDEGSTLLPSVVHYRPGGGPGSVVVGAAARRLAADFPPRHHRQRQAVHGAVFGGSGDAAT